MMGELIHKTKDGKKIPLSQLKDDHLINIIKVHKKLAKEGITIRSGGGSTPEDIWYDEEDIFGKRVLKYFHHDKYLKEAKKRGLCLKIELNQ